MQYVSGRRINQDFGIPGITTNDTVVNVDGRIAVGIGTSATTDIDTNQIRIRDNIIDSRGVIGSMGYFLTKDVEGVTWTNVPPLGNNSIFLAEDGDILNNIGLQTYTGLNIISDQLLGITTNPDNPGFADIRIDPRWFRDRTQGENGGLYTTRTVGIGSTQPRFGPVGVLTDVKLDVLGDAIFTGVVSATSFTGEFNVDTKDLKVSGIATFTNTEDNVLGNVDTGAVQIDGGVGIAKNVSIGQTLQVGTAVTIGNGAVIANTGDFINLELDNLNVIGLSTFGQTARFNSNVDIFDDLFVSGNISVGGTGVTLDTESIRIEGKELLIGFTTTITPNDTTANAAGIAVASTEGYFLVDLQVPGINTTPNTYKQFKWFKNGTFVGQGTDAFISNNPISIGRTQIGNGQLFAVGDNINFTEDQITTKDLKVNEEVLVGTAISMSAGIITANRFDGNFLTIEQLTITGIATINSGIVSDLTVTGVSTFVGLSTFGTVAIGTANVIGDDKLTIIGDARLGGANDTLRVGNDISMSAGIITALKLEGEGGTIIDISGGGTVITGIVTVGESSITLDGSSGTESIVIGSGITLSSVSDSTFANNVNINGRIVGAATSNVIPFLYSNFSDLPSPVTYHGAFAHVHSEGKAYFAHAANWYELVNKELNGTVGIGSTTDKYNIGELKVTGISTLGDVKISTGIVTAASGIVTYYGDGQFLQNVITGVGIQSSGSPIGTGFTTLNFIGTGNTIVDAGNNTVNISINSSEFSGIASNLAGGAGGSIPYQSAADTTVFLANGNAGQVLVSSGGTGAPSWQNGASTGAIDGITVQDEDSTVGSAGSVSTLNFKGNGVTATASGTISTITFTIPSIPDVDGSAGIASTARDVIGGIASVTDLEVSGISTLGNVKISAGIITSTTGTPVNYFGNLTGTASTASFATTAFSLDSTAESNLNVAFAQTAGIATEATRLATARTIALSGDVIATPTLFDGTSNISIAATIQPNSVELGDDTTGDYVQNVSSGNLQQISVANTTGEGANVTIEIVNNPTLPGNVTIENDLTVNGDLLIVGAGATLFVDEFKVSDKNIIAGFTTDSNGNETSSDSTANAGGVAVASTVGDPLVDLIIAGIDTHPSAYKRLYWYQSAAFSGLGTDAWLTNYALGVGTTQFPTGTYFAAGNVQITENDLAAVRNINSSGIVTATTFSGNLPTTDLTGTITNAQLAGSIENSKLLNDSVSYGGIELDLGQSDATPAFDLSDATNYPYTSLTGITTEIVGDTTPQLGGDLDLNSRFITGTGGIDVTGVVTATTFSGNLPTTDLTGTITNAQLAGSIENSKLLNDSVSYGGVSLDLGQSDATPAFDLTDATNYPYTSLTGITTEIVGDTTPQLGGNLDLNNKDITGTGNVNITGVITATTFSGNLPTTDLTGTITNAQLAGSIENSKLLNDSVSYGGVSLDLGQSDATPAFDLSDATNYPYTSLTGITTEILGDLTPQLGGNLDLNNKDITGTGNVNITGIITATSAVFSGNVSIAGTLTYDDVTNVDSIGLITARNGISVTGGVSTFTGAIDANGDLDVDGHTELDNLNVSGVSTFRNTVYLEDYNKLKFGLSESTPDLEIYHDSSRNSFIDSNTKSLFIRNNVDDDGVRGDIVLQAKSGDDSAKFVDEGQVELYYDNSKKFETTGAGVTVFGTTQTQQLNVIGVSTFGSDLSIEDKIVHSGDTNTAIRFPAADTFTVETAGSERLRIDSNGLVGIGTDNPSEKLDVNGNVKAIDFNTTSDQNLKTNIHTIDDPLEKVIQIRGVNFDWKETQKPSVGVIAQEVEKVFPELVTSGEKKTVNYNGLIGLLIEVVKEQQTQINSLNERLSRLE